MRLAKVTGTVTATVKDPALAGKSLLIADAVDASGKVKEPAIVAVDTVGAGVGQTVLIAQGSAARLPAGAASSPVDATIIAVVDSVQNGKA